MSDLANDAVTGASKEAFTDFRKLTACGVALATGGSGTEAAVAADKSVFQKALDYAVGNGIMSGGDAVEAAIDRTAAHFTAVARQAAAQLVEKGCVAAGTWLGSLVGQPVLGAAIGAKIGTLLNAPVQELVSKGMEKVKEIAKTGWQKIKAGARSAVNKLKSWLFG